MYRARMRTCLYTRGKWASLFSEISPHYEVNRNICFSLYEKAGESGKRDLAEALVRSR